MNWQCVHRLPLAAFCWASSLAFSRNIALLFVRGSMSGFFSGAASAELLRRIVCGAVPMLEFEREEGAPLVEAPPLKELGGGRATEGRDAAGASVDRPRLEVVRLVDPGVLSFKSDVDDRLSGTDPPVRKDDGGPLEFAIFAARNSAERFALGAIVGVMVLATGIESRRLCPGTLS